MGDVNMGGTITPSKVDKAYRYQKNGVSSRKHVSGKGEIRPRHDLDVSEVTRRKRRQHEREFGNHRRLNSQDSDEDSDASYENYSRHRSRPKTDRHQDVRGGVIGSMFHMMEEHHNAPENLHRWIQLGINVFLGGTFCAVVLSVMQTIRSDIRAVNEGARQEIRAKMAVCQDHYLSNGCATTDAPAFKALCSEWHDCMMQDPESIVRVRATMAEAANIMNDFFGNLNLKAWVSRIALSKKSPGAEPCLICVKIGSVLGYPAHYGVCQQHFRIKGITKSIDTRTRTATFQSRARSCCIASQSGRCDVDSRTNSQDAASRILGRRHRHGWLAAKIAEIHQLR